MNTIIVFFANILGYLLEALYSLCGNFGVAIVFFSIVTKLLLLPLTLKQQKSAKQMAKVQPKLQEIQDKYKDDKERYAQEYTKLQKEEKFNPFAGCLLSLVQIPIILAMFYIVSCPLTYMKKMNIEQIDTYKQELNINAESGRRIYPEIEIIKQKPELGIKLDFLGINLGDVPSQNKNNLYLLIIPVLSIIFTLLSVKLTTKMQNDMYNNSEQMKKSQEQMKVMNYMLPVLSGYIAYKVPLGLGLYWLCNNLGQIVQQYYINLKIKDDTKDDDIIKMGADKIE